MNRPRCDWGDKICLSSWTEKGLPMKYINCGEYQLPGLVWQVLIYLLNSLSYTHTCTRSWNSCTENVSKINQKWPKTRFLFLHQSKTYLAASLWSGDIGAHMRRVFTRGQRSRVIQRCFTSEHGEKAGFLLFFSSFSLIFFFQSSQRN